MHCYKSTEGLYRPARVKPRNRSKGGPGKPFVFDVSPVVAPLGFLRA